MTDEILKKANDLKKEISSLEWFVKYAEKCWSKLAFENSRMRKRIIKHKGYGCFTDGEYKLSKELSLKILDVMKQHLAEIEEEYESLGKE